jgi:hypothetical protein
VSGTVTPTDGGLVRGKPRRTVNTWREVIDILAGGLGFEPRLAESESAVLPLDDPPSDVRLESGPIARWIDSTTRRWAVGLSVTVLPGTCVRFVGF